MKISALVPAQALLSLANVSTINTTSGQLIGNEADGVRAFTGVRFAQPPVGELRWEPPVPYTSSDIVNATTPGPSCLQMFKYATAKHDMRLFNTPPPPGGENEDCLFLNVWAPTGGKKKKPVVVWIHGGSDAFGSATLAEYDGTSMAKNQDIIVVSMNYRTNVFGFPSAPDLAPDKNNLGQLDQELAFSWVQDNIEHFEGDKHKVTIMGQSAGARAVSDAVSRHTEANPPFRAAIMLSGAVTSTVPTLHFAAFNNFANASGCTQAPGAARLDCLRQIPAATIHNYTNGPLSGTFDPVVDNMTRYDDDLTRIRTNNTARVPILIGSLQDDGTVFTSGVKNLTTALPDLFGANAPSVATVRALYPGLNDSQVIAAAYRDKNFRCPAKLWSEAFVGSGIEYVYRYTYGASFADDAPYPNLGAWHTSELPELFGTYNASTATADEETLSNSFQTAFANFVKNPKVPPAANWPEYGSGTVAKIAYNGNVDLDNFIQPVASGTLDGPCAVWDKLLDFRP
ncbi:alpha/beta-hydrolase [Artomyces pyxidatus]|uniref:Alpha/beta-hydrolase n=1 Tax=Artomyces pyxidatus TaxID=48021 RepID=A0ACB8T354_9AGAM|nr:alpha/beta-hydrolase [Artomyces pyxidatus]